MKALARTHRWIWLLRHQPLTVRLLATAGAIITAAAAFAAPAEADPIDDAFISALDNGGVNYGDAGSAATLGQSVCPMLSQPGGTFASAASSITGTNGMSPQMADTFTSIAISMYCPTAMADIAGGNTSSLPQIPGLPGI